MSVPHEVANLLAAFASLFSRPVFHHVQVLLVGATLATGKHTVSAALRVMGLSHEKHFQNDHCVLNRAVWSSPGASRILLNVLLAAFALGVRHGFAPAFNLTVRPPGEGEGGDGEDSSPTPHLNPPPQEERRIKGSTLVDAKL